MTGVSHLLWGLSSNVVLYRGRGVAHSQLSGVKNKTHGNAFILSDETKPPQKQDRTAAENWSSLALSILLGGSLRLLQDASCAAKRWSRFTPIVSWAYVQENTEGLVHILADREVTWKLPAHRLAELA